MTIEGLFVQAHCQTGSGTSLLASDGHTRKTEMPKVDLAGNRLSTFETFRLFWWLTDAKTAQSVAPPEVCCPELLEIFGLIWCVRSLFRSGRCDPLGIYSPSSGEQPRTVSGCL